MAGEWGSRLHELRVRLLRAMSSLMWAPGLRVLSAALLVGLTCIVCLGGNPHAGTDTAVATQSPIETHPDSAATAQQVRLDKPEIPEVIQRLLQRLEAADEFLSGTSGYAATFTQQVRKDDRLLDPERMALKLRHEPFSVFMQWERDGQQALYVAGQHEDKLLVHPTRGLGRLRRVWILDPEQGLAMRSSLRPVTEMGLLNMVKLLRGFHYEHILQSQCVAHPEQDGDRQLTRYTLTFETPEQNPYFAKTHLWLCNDRHIPVRLENYSWTTDQQVGPLLERYEYTDITLEAGLTDADFDRQNEAYSF